jgi:hypothetical protein
MDTAQLPATGALGLYRAQTALRQAADNLGPETARRINAALSSIPGDDFATDADRVVHLLDPAAVQFEALR